MRLLLLENRGKQMRRAHVCCCCASDRSCVCCLCLHMECQLLLSWVLCAPCPAVSQTTGFTPHNGSNSSSMSGCVRAAFVRCKHSARVVAGCVNTARNVWCREQVLSTDTGTGQLDAACVNDCLHHMHQSHLVSMLCQRVCIFVPAP